MNWAQIQRQKFIEYKLLYDGRLNRRDIVDFFGVTMLQASTDIKGYRTRFPESMTYDPRKKTFFNNVLSPRYISYNPAEWKFFQKLTIKEWEVQ